MNVTRLLRWCLPAACLMVAGLSSGSTAAAPLIAQPNLAQAVAPTAVSFHRWGCGYGRCYGWGSYHYGRPSLYYSGYYRPYRSVVRYNYVPAYSYNYGSPYYVNSYRTLSCSSCASSCSTCSAETHYQPAVYSPPTIYSPPVVYSQPAAYTEPVYAQSVYTSGYYVRPLSYYSGYSTYSYPRYRTVGVSVGGFGYSSFSPYYDWNW